jgi:hypothetical protein
MTELSTISLQLLAGTLAAVALAWWWPALSQNWPGVPVLGALGGVMIGQLRDHILGGHHHMSGTMANMDMSKMGSVPGVGSAQMVLDLSGGAGGGAVLLGLAAVICWIVPGR